MIDQLIAIVVILAILVVVKTVKVFKMSAYLKESASDGISVADTKK